MYSFVLRSPLLAKLALHYRPERLFKCYTGALKIVPVSPMFDKSLEFSSSLHTIHMLNPNWTVQQCVYILIFQKYRAFTLRLTQQHGISVDFSEARPNQPYRPESTFYTECVRCETSLEFTLWIYRRYRISNLKGGKMALGSCHTCIKYLMFAFNFLFWVSGL